MVSQPMAVMSHTSTVTLASYAIIQPDFRIEK